MVQKATYYNMPIAIGNAPTSEIWSAALNGFDVLTYWFLPDSLFAGLDLRAISFPKHVAQQWDDVLRVTASEDLDLMKFAASNLGAVASDAVHVATMLAFSMDDIMGMIKDLGDSVTHHQVACTWIRDNRDIWGAWLPDGITCVDGQGLVEENGQFLDSPFGAIKCEWCQPGSSSQLWNATEQKVCEPCAAGTAQKLPGQTECKLCEVGRFSGQSGQASCEMCPLGTFADVAGTTVCATCPLDGEVTVFLGAGSRWDCVCDAGYFRQSGHSEVTSSSTPCQPCPEGMVCGTSNAAPTLMEGYWADAADSSHRAFSVYMCRNTGECPGGAVGSCAAGREGIGCAFCKANHVRSNIGTCSQCDGSHVLFGAIAILTILMVIGGIALHSSRDFSKTTQNAITVGIIAGQAITIMQTFQVFSIMKVKWVEPYLTVMEILAFFTFDLDRLGASCFLDDSDTVLKYIATLLIYPATVFCLIVTFAMLSSFTTRAITANRVLNSLGLLTMILFLLLTMHGISPFHCVSNPNGSASLRSSPATICYEGEWSVMAILGGISFCIYGVAFLAWCIWAAVKYPSIVTSPSGATLVTRYAFMFQRFTADCFYDFTPIYLFRALLINFIVVFFPDHGHRQLLALTVVFVVFGLITAWLRPWRGRVANHLEVLVSFCLVISLACVGLILEVNDKIINSDLQVVLSVTLVTCLGAIVWLLGLFTWRSVQHRVKYAAFLCHHKLGCGAGARWMKLELEQRLRAEVFLDSDNLDEIDALLDIVRCEVQNLVVLLTTETLSRPWCAGEIATAFSNKVRIVPVAFDNYEDPAEDQLTVSNIRARWNAEDFADCQRNGVSFEVVLEAYVYLQGLRKVACHRVFSCLNSDILASTRTIQHVAAMCRDRPVEDVDDLSPIAMPGGASLPHSPAQFEVAILADRLDAEAISSCAVIGILIRRQTQWQTMELFTPRSVKAAVASDKCPKNVMALLTEGSLASEGFCSMLVMAQDPWNSGSKKVLPVRSEAFKFPSGQALEQRIAPQVASALGRDAEEVAAALKSLFTTIAVTFSCTAGIATLNMEIATILSRYERMQGSRRGATREVGKTLSGRSDIYGSEIPDA
jgi:hypothetical protein